MNGDLWYSIRQPFRKHFYQCLSVDVLLKDYKLEPSMLSSVSTVNSCFSTAGLKSSFYCRMLFRPQVFITQLFCLDSSPLSPTNNKPINT